MRGCDVRDVRRKLASLAPVAFFFPEAPDRDSRRDGFFAADMLVLPTGKLRV